MNSASHLSMKHINGIFIAENAIWTPITIRLRLQWLNTQLAHPRKAFMVSSFMHKNINRDLLSIELIDSILMDT